MNRSSTLFLVLLRISIGWYFLYQGIAAWLDAKWSIVPYIKGSVIFPKFYLALGDSALLPYIGIVFKVLFVLVGLCLIFGIFVRLVSIIGAVIMLFFYIPLLKFPYVSNEYYIIDYHIIFAIALLYFFSARAGDYFSLGTKFGRYK